MIVEEDKKNLNEISDDKHIEEIRIKIEKQIEEDNDNIRRKVEKQIKEDNEFQDDRQNEQQIDDNNNSPIELKQIDNNINFSIELQLTEDRNQSLIEKILLNPETYIGIMELVQEKCWIYDSTNENFVLKNLTYVPGLLKIFEEILVTVRENIKKDPQINNVIIDIDKENSKIVVCFNGKGVPIEINQENGIYLPELIYSHLTDEKDINRVKLINIFSTKLVLETGDSTNKKKYTQIFYDNMSVKDEPIIEDYEEKDFTKITFEPDLSKFNMDKFDENIIQLFEKKVYDFAGVQFRNILVYLNGVALKINGFRNYVDLYLKDMKKACFRQIISQNDKWEVILAKSENGFKHISFVNGIFTSKGGTHVEIVVDKIIKKLTDYMLKIDRRLKATDLKANMVKPTLSIFINCLIDNPIFDSLTKEQLISKPETFQSTFGFKEGFFRQLYTSPILEGVIQKAKELQRTEIEKQISNNKKKAEEVVINPTFDILRLKDAYDAGTESSQSCTLIVTDSEITKSLAMSGIEGIGREKFGVYSLKGKLINVKETGEKKILFNEDIQNLMKATGLQKGKDYASDTTGLRYGSILIMCDTKSEGVQTKGLIISFIHHFWPSLIKLNTYIKMFVPPLVRLSKLDDVILFYTIKDLKDWQINNPDDSNKYEIKFNNSLTSITPQEIKQYFKSINDNITQFIYEDEEDDDAINSYFRKTNNTDCKKEKIYNFDLENKITNHKGKIRIKDFMDNEMAYVTIEEYLRTMPNVVDGFRQTERKIIFGMMNKQSNIKFPIKIFQLSGLITEMTGFKRGESSLSNYILNMARDFVGTNNINLILPLGQFGSRFLGSEVYKNQKDIYTDLNKIVRKIFREEDESLLIYTKEDGEIYEPLYYIPIIPMILVNGSYGNKNFGKTFYTDVSQYDPREIVDNIIRKLNGEEYKEMLPWFRNYKGEVLDMSKDESYKVYNFTGKIKILDEDEEKNCIDITEIPLNTNIKTYREFLLTLHVDNKEKLNLKYPFIEIRLTDIKEYHYESHIYFRLKLTDQSFQSIKKMPDDYRLKVFKLTENFVTSNMNLLDINNKIKKFPNVFDILNDYYEFRFNLYSQRKENMIGTLKYDILILGNKLKFVKFAKNYKVDFLFQMNKEEISNLLKDNHFDSIIELKKRFKFLYRMKIYDFATGFEEIENQRLIIKNESDFDYLLDMNILSFNFDMIKELEETLEKSKMALSYIESQTEKDLWEKDLDEFLIEFDKFLTSSEIVREEQINFKTYRREDDNVYLDKMRKIEKLNINNLKIIKVLNENIKIDNSFTIEKFKSCSGNNIKIDEKKYNYLEKELNQIFGQDNNNLLDIAMMISGNKDDEEIVENILNKKDNQKINIINNNKVSENIKQNNNLVQNYIIKRKRGRKLGYRKQDEVEKNNNISQFGKLDNTVLKQFMRMKKSYSKPPIFRIVIDKKKKLQKLFRVIEKLRENMYRKINGKQKRQKRIKIHTNNNNKISYDNKKIFIIHKKNRNLNQINSIQKDYIQKDLNQNSNNNKIVNLQNINNNKIVNLKNSNNKIVSLQITNNNNRIVNLQNTYNNKIVNLQNSNYNNKIVNLQNSNYNNKIVNIQSNLHKQQKFDKRKELLKKLNKNLEKFYSAKNNKYYKDFKNNFLNKPISQNKMPQKAYNIPKENKITNNLTNIIKNKFEKLHSVENRLKISLREKLANKISENQCNQRKPIESDILNEDEEMSHSFLNNKRKSSQMIGKEIKTIQMNAGIQDFEIIL